MKKIFSILAVSVALAACSVNELIGSEETVDSPTFYASIEGQDVAETKTYVDNQLIMRWTKDDEVSIFAGKTLNQCYKFDGETGSTNGSFSPVGSHGSILAADPLNANYAVYPYASTTEMDAGGNITFTLPAVQHYSENTFGLGANTMVAVSKDIKEYSLQFKNVCGYLVINLYGDKIVKSVSITGNNGEKLSGNATISVAPDDAPILSMNKEAAESITIDCGEGVSIGADASSATQFWFCIPPVSFTKGFTITITNEGGSTIDIKTTASREISRNVVYTLPAHIDSSDIDLGEEGQQDGEEIILSEDELNIREFPDEDNCPLTNYSEDVLLQMDSIARKLLELNGFMTEPAYKTQSSIKNININNLGTYEVENIIWNAGDWGASHWAGDKISCMYDADYVNGDKVLTVTLYRAKGLQSGTAYLKLGTLNSGPCLCSVPISAGQQYVTLQLNIDKVVTINDKVVNLLPDYGLLNIFPLIVYGNGYREYLNQICIKSIPIVPYGWNSEDNNYGYYFGTINGVGVYHNGNSTSSDGKAKYNQNTNQTGHSCVELCKRYLTTMYSLNRKATDAWGDANAWPENRMNDSKDDYLVYANDGSNQPREGDMIVFKTSGKYGHIGVIIKTEHYLNENHISYAHQNGGIKTDQRPIGTTAKWEGNKVLYDSDVARETTYFIRKDNLKEHSSSVKYEEIEDDPVPMFSINKTTLDFGYQVIGEYEVERFTITNSGTAPLIISSITVPEGFKCKYNSKTIDPNSDNPNSDLEVPVRFDPVVAKNYDGYCVIRTNAGTKKVKLNAEGISGGGYAPEGAVDMGLSVYWASCNIGASKPEEYGRYFGWGDITGQTWDGQSGSGGGFYDTPEYAVDSKGNLKPEYDAAHVILGGNWRMPTMEECQELIDNTTNIWTSINGVNGIRFQSKINGNSVFMPAGGQFCYGSVEYHYSYYNGEGYYRNSTIDRQLDNYGGDLFFRSGVVWTGFSASLWGELVRPVWD